jgi:hypothetical protein
MMGARRRVSDFFFLLAHVAFRHGVFGLGIASALGNLGAWRVFGIWYLEGKREKGYVELGLGGMCDEMDGDYE